MAHRRHKNNYFEMFIEAIGFSQQALDYLREIMTDYNSDPVVLKEQMDKMHIIEHSADNAKHELMEKLVKEFITPIEREDILALSNVIDDITDQIEDIIQQMYMFGVEEVREEAMEFIDIIDQCIGTLNSIFEEFHNFKRSTKNIHKNVIAVNRLEGEGDALYIKAVRRLYEEKENPYITMSWTTIFLRLERCCDSCERVANLVEEVMMKNL